MSVAVLLCFCLGGSHPSDDFSPFAFSCRPKDAFRAIKKRIVGNKNFHEVMLALTVSGHNSFLAL